jgi:hypothetical protein
VLLPKHSYKEPYKVYIKNLEYSESLPVHHETIFGQFKVREVIYTGPIKSSYDRILSMETVQSYLINRKLASDMEGRLDGLSLVPVIHYKNGELIEGWSSFKSEIWLQKLSVDQTSSININSDNGYKYIENFGLLSSDDEYLKGLPDIFKLPEADLRGDSRYVASQRLFLYWLEKGIKSFWIVPLLNTNSKEYEDYLSLWRQVKGCISIHPKNGIRS